MIDNPWILLGVFPAIAYVIGSTPFGVLIARTRNVDLRKQGSGNVGATNVGRVLGRTWGFLCFFLDVSKGLLPVVAAGVWLRPSSGELPILAQSALLAVGFGAIMGHVFSFYLGFRGGKGVATSLGVVLGIYPYFTWAALGALGAWIAVTLISRYVSLGSIVAALSFLGFFAAFNHARLDKVWPMGAFAGVMVALIVLRHRTNIRRLLAGTENKIGQGKSPKA
jgi:acyl phosphate:glycerol-3-phosphate acyltransferase